MKNLKVKILTSFLVILLFFSLASFALAATSEQNSGAFSSSLKGNYFSFLNIAKNAPGYPNINPDQPLGVFTNIVAWVISLVGIIFLILTIYSGLTWMTASGNEEKISAAKQRLTHASIGLGITLCAFVISYAVFSFLYQQYLTTPPSNQYETPAGPNLPSCTSSPDCANQGSLLYCLNPPGNCVECITDDNCYTSYELGLVPWGVFYCHPDWHTCNFPPDAPCGPIFFNDPDFCMANNCIWRVPAPGTFLANATWENGACVEESPCIQCEQEAPLCFNGACRECVDASLDPQGQGNREACSFSQTCIQYNCWP